MFRRPRARRRVWQHVTGAGGLLVVSAVMLIVAVLPAKATPSTPADLAWVQSSQFRTTLGTMTPTAAASGAFGINARWEAGQSAVWYVSQQEAAADAIAYGIANSNTQAIELGLKELDWTFAHQQPDGSFEPQYDIVASQVITSVLFTRAAARALLLLQASSYGTAYAGRIAGYLPPLQKAIDWYTADIRWSAWKRHVDNATGYGYFLHQDYEAAAAIAMTSLLTGDRSQMPKAYERLDTALSLQSPQGWLMEIKGPDTGYGALGVSAALEYAQWLPDDPRSPQLLAMVDKAIEWESSRVAPDGWIDHAGNTRTCVAREGMKDPGYTTMVDHFGSWALMNGEPELNPQATALLSFARTQNARRCEERGTTYTAILPAALVRDAPVAAAATTTTTTPPAAAAGPAAPTATPAAAAAPTQAAVPTTATKTAATKRVSAHTAKARKARKAKARAKARARARAARAT